MSESVSALVADCEIQGDQATIVLRGEFDIIGKESFVAAIATALAADVTDVAIDMSEVSFIDSSGVGALLEAHRLGLAIVVHRPSERVRKLLDLVLIGDIIPIEDV
jgi:anti-sigma B factor antagonist